MSKKGQNQDQKIVEQNKEILMAHWSTAWLWEWWRPRHGCTLRDNKRRGSSLGLVQAVVKKCKDSKLFLFFFF